MPRALSTASLSLGLVSIPVGLYPTRSRAGRVSYHLVHAKDGSRVKRQYVCEEEGVPIGDGELARAYEGEEGEPVVMTHEEAKQAAPSATGRIDLLEFVPAATVDPVYLDSAYWLAPGKGGDRAYHLLAETLRGLDVVGVGTQLARGKSYLVMVRATEQGLAMHTLHYADEVKPEDDVKHADPGKISASERQMAKMLVEQQLQPRFDPSRFADEADERMRAAIAARTKAGLPETPAKPTGRGKGQVVDLVAALKASLEAQSEAGHAKQKRTKARAHRPARATRSTARRTPTRAAASAKKPARARTARARRAAT